MVAALSFCGILFQRPYRLTVRTEPSQGLNRGSIPRRVMVPKRPSLSRVFWCHNDHLVVRIEKSAFI